MNALDPRLVRRARPVRMLLALDASLGVVAALLVLAQAALLAHVAARGFAGASLAELTLPLALLVARRGRARGVPRGASRSSAGAPPPTSSRSSGSTSSSGGCATGRRRSTRAESAEVATAAVAGVDALEATFARYLPQLVLATVVPVAVLAFVAVDRPALRRPDAADAAARARLHVARRPLHRAAHARALADARAALDATSSTSSAGCRRCARSTAAQAQAERIAQVSDEYRRATMGTLRVAFLSGAVLELAATLGIALVAVTVGVRLVEGGLGFEAGLTVLVLAPELYLPLRNLAAQFHASADGLAVAERLLDLLGAAAGGRDGQPPAGRSPCRPDPARGGLVLLPRPPRHRARRGRPRARARRDGRARRAEREREEHDRLAAPPPRRADLGAHHGRRDRSRRVRRGGLAGAARLGAAAPDALPRHGGGQHPARRPGGERRPRGRGRRAGGRRRVRPSRCRTATRRSSATAAARSRRASSSGSRSRGRSSATPRSSSSTSRPRTSTAGAPSSSTTPSSGSARGAPCCSSRTAPSWPGLPTAC